MTSRSHRASFASVASDIAVRGRSSRRQFRYLYMFRLWAFAISTIVYTTALASAPLAVSLNSQFFLPRVNGRIALSGPDILFFARKYGFFALTAAHIQTDSCSIEPPGQPDYCNPVPFLWEQPLRNACANGPSSIV